MLDLSDFEEKEFSRTLQNKEDSNDKRFELPVKTKGTFVVSYPTSSSSSNNSSDSLSSCGIVATSDVLFQNNSCESSSSTTRIDLLKKMEKVANAAGLRLFEVFREASSSKTGDEDQEGALQEDAAMTN